ncbi:hypothetical protein HOY82DRAFT_73072 [Tuber indicum]|nr:hypothetical protein HOY82DRAFT_73072 [Tuber indicum]
MLVRLRSYGENGLSLVLVLRFRLLLTLAGKVGSPTPRGEVSVAGSKRDEISTGEPPFYRLRFWRALNPSSFPSFWIWLGAVVTSQVKKGLLTKVSIMRSLKEHNHYSPFSQQLLNSPEPYLLVSRTPWILQGHHGWDNKGRLF